MSLTRRTLIGAAGAAPVAALAVPAAGAPRKVLRLAFNAAETSMDPARILDAYSRALTAHIFEALYTYDPLARPARLVPLTAEALPEVSADFRTWTMRVRPGIFFADDPAFGGRPRELVAADYVYSISRIADPANRSPLLSSLLAAGIVGLREAHERALGRRAAEGDDDEAGAAPAAARPFDYERPIEGLRALDRYTLRVLLEQPRPRFAEVLAQSDLLGAVAREVVERYGKDIDAHPVGTGPFRLKQWRRSSLIVLERNPGFREQHFEAQPAPDDAEGQAILARLRGRRLPMIDEVQVSIIEENQPRWLAFANGQTDALASLASPLPSEFVPLALPGGRLAPNLARRGVQLQRTLNPDAGITLFNMEHPLVGGLDAAHVALRRAVSLAFDVPREIRLLRRGQAVPAQGPVVPHTSGYDPHFKSEMGDFDPARARALLELYGWRDADGDGWREQPDGRPLTLEITTESDQISRQYDELWQRCMRAVGLRTRFLPGQWPDNFKAARAGKAMIWLLGSFATAPDGQDLLARWYGPQAGQQNLARFRLPAFDRLYERMLTLPDGPERDGLFHQAQRLAVAYMPYKVHVHRIANDLLHPWVTGYRRPQFRQDWWQHVDLDTELRARMTA